MFTARGSTTQIDWTEVTQNQLQSWGLKYHKLFISKPSADIYIDDKSYGYDKSWVNRFKKLTK